MTRAHAATSRPLDGDALLTYVEERCADLGVDLSAIDTIDTASPAYQAGLKVGAASAYHDVSHMMRGWYGPDWMAGAETGDADAQGV